MTDKRKELYIKYDQLEDQREELVKKMNRYYERGDALKIKIYEMEQKIKAIAKEIKKC
jgi:cell division protein FtsB